MASHPPAISGTPVDVGFRFQVEHHSVSESNLGEIAARGVHDALRLCRGTGGIEDEEKVLGIHCLWFVLSGSCSNHLVVPVVPALLHGDIRVASI